MIDYSAYNLHPDQSSAARAFLGLSQAAAATKAALPVNKLKRFESKNHIVDSDFVDALRAFYESEGYSFHDEDTPGAKARSRGDVFPAGVVGDDGGALATGDSRRPASKQLHYVRIDPSLDTDQIDRMLDRVEDNEAKIDAIKGKPFRSGFLSGISSVTEVDAAVALRCLAENGLLYARLLGRSLIEAPTDEQRKTVGDLLGQAMPDTQRAVIDGDREALARLKERGEPEEVVQALIG